MSEDLTIADLDLIRESLAFSIGRFQEYNGYPSEEYRRERIAEAEAIRKKALMMKRQLKARKAS